MNPAVGWAMDALRNPTRAEAALEPAVAALGLPYRAQWPLLAFRYRADFALITERVILEVDDPDHESPEKAEADRARTAALAEEGWVVVRCTNADALDNPWATVNRMVRQAGIYITVAPDPRGIRVLPTGRAHDVPSRPVEPVDPTRWDRTAPRRRRAAAPAKRTQRTSPGGSQRTPTRTRSSGTPRTAPPAAARARSRPQ